MQIAYVFIALLAIITCWQLYYHFRYFIKLAAYRPAEGSNFPKVPVSVIVVARNEYKNLEANLESWLNQDYPDFEVVVVNNGSWDKSQEYLELMEEKHARLKVVKIVEQERYPKGKKFGLTLGIKAASNEWMLLTDSDCRPQSTRWIQEMSRYFVQGKSITLGYSPYTKKNTVLNFLIRWDTFYTALQYLSFSLAGKTYMGVGRNLAYTKSLFFSVKGFASHNHLIAGDDDLFINETATPSNTSICIHPDAFVASTPKTNFGDWIKQKRRHLGVGKEYKASNKWRIAGLHMSNSLFYASLIPAAIFCWPIKTDYLYLFPIGIYVLRLLSQYFIFGFAMKRLKETNLLYLLPFLDLYFLFFYFFMGVGATFRKPQRMNW